MTWEIESRSKMCLLRDQLLAQNFDAVLAVIVKLVGGLIFVITHFKTPQEYTYCRSALGTWDWGGVEMWCGWVGMGAGNDSCGRDWRLKILFVYLPASLL